LVFAVQFVALQPDVRYAVLKRVNRPIPYLRPLVLVVEFDVKVGKEDDSRVGGEEDEKVPEPVEVGEA